MENVDRITFVRVSGLLHVKDDKKRWVNIYILLKDESDISFAKKHLEKGQEAIEILERLKEYYEQIKEKS